jgi:hypothetical protein
VRSVRQEGRRRRRGGGVEGGVGGGGGGGGGGRGGKWMVENGRSGKNGRGRAADSVSSAGAAMSIIRRRALGVAREGGCAGGTRLFTSRAQHRRHAEPKIHKWPRGGWESGASLTCEAEQQQQQQERRRLRRGRRRRRRRSRGRPVDAWGRHSPIIRGGGTSVRRPDSAASPRASPDQRGSLAPRTRLALPSSRPPEGV